MHDSRRTNELQLTQVFPLACVGVFFTDLEDFTYKDFPHTSSPVTVSGVVRTSISRALFDESHCEETLAEFFCDTLLRVSI